MKTSSIAKYHPKLQGIFGPLDKSEEEYLRGVLAQVDIELSRIAKHFARNSAGLEMQWNESGQLSIAGYVGVADSESHVVDFIVELWPSWMHEPPARETEWVVETSIDADCQHVPEHASMDNVFIQQERKRSPESSVDELLNAAHQLAAMAMNNPIEHWTSKAKS